MARHYSTRDFFRQMPNALLARYFQGRDVLDHLNFTTMKDTQPDELFMAWLSLPDDKRKGMDAEFQSLRRYRIRRPRWLPQASSPRAHLALGPLPTWHCLVFSVRR